MSDQISPSTDPDQIDPINDPNFKTVGDVTVADPAMTCRNVDVFLRKQTGHL